MVVQCFTYPHVLHGFKNFTVQLDVNQADLLSGSVTNWDAGDGTGPQDISRNLSPKKTMNDKT